MEDQEIIAARHEYERGVWASFGRTMLRMPDMSEARRAHSEYCSGLRAALDPEVVATLKPWQGGPPR